MVEVVSSEYCAAVPKRDHQGGKKRPVAVADAKNMAAVEQDVPLSAP